MNMPTSQKVSGLLRAGVLPFLALWLSLALAACSSLAPPSVTSIPLPAQQQAMIDANRAYPSFSAFPRTDEPVPSDADIRQKVTTLETWQTQLVQAVAAIDWQTADPATLGPMLAARVAALGRPPEPVTSPQAMQQALDRARERGRAPPPVDRH